MENGNPLQYKKFIKKPKEKDKLLKFILRFYIFYEMGKALSDLTQ